MLRYLCALIGALVLAVAGLSTAHARGFVPEKSAHGFVTRAGGYTPGHGETPEQSCGQFVQINGFTDPKYWSAVAQYSACMVLYGPNTYVYAVTNVEFRAQCPAWSTKSGAGCTCDAGFKPDASRLECVPYDVKGPAQPEMCPVPGKSAPQDGAFIGNPILGATGEKRITELDYADGTAHGLTLVRTWRSAQEPLGEAARSAGLGPQWNHNHNVSLVRDGSQYVQITFGDGTVRAFQVAAPYQPWTPLNSSDRLIDLQPGWKYTRASDDTTWYFNYDNRLTQVTTRERQNSLYSYSDATTAADIAPRPGLLIAVTNHFGRSLRFRYDDSARLVAAVAPDGQVITYQHGSVWGMTGVTWQDGATRGYLYEQLTGNGLIEGITDSAGNRIATYAYDAAGRGTRTEHAGGANRYQVSYGADAATVTDPLGTARTYAYGTQLGRVVVNSASQASGSGDSDAASRIHDAQGRVLQETDFAGIRTLYTWEGNRNLPTTITRAVGRPEAQSLQTQWHPTLSLPLVVTEAGRRTDYSYDADGKKLAQTTTDLATNQSRTTNWAYDSNRLVVRINDSRGVWQFGYDDQGNRTRMIDPLGRQTSYAYDAGGRMLSQSEPGGSVTSYGYDLRGRLIWQTRGADTTTFSYNNNGQLAGVTLANGYALSYSYDLAQRLVAATDNRGNSVHYTLDAMGNRIGEQVKDAGGSIALATSRIINGMNRVSAIQGAAGQTTSLGYDANGEPVSQSDPLNHMTMQTLDGLRRTTATTLADGATASQGWSQLDQLTQVTDPKGVATHYTYNAFGEVLTETSPDIGTIQYTRNAAGDVTAMQDARGQITTITRDALGRPSEIRYAGDHVSSFSYDAAGQVSRIDDKSGGAGYARDVQGRITIVTRSVNDNPSNPSQYTTGYSYAGGDLAGIRYPSGLNIYYRRTAGRITGIDVQPPQGSALAPRPVAPLMSKLTHTALGQPKSWTWSNGDTAERSFDADGRMTANEFASYSRDAASRIVGITQNLHAQGATGTVYVTPLAFTVGYDARNRLTSFTRDGAQTKYSYDANSNRLTALDRITSDTDLDAEFDSTDFARATSQSLALEPTSNRLLGFVQTVVQTSAGRTTSTVVTPVNYALDANGSMTSDGLRTFDYDASNRLAKVRLTHNGEAASVSYLTNAMGQRVFKSEYQAEQTLPNEAELGLDFVTWLKKRFGWLFAKAQANASIGTAYIYGDGPIPGYAMLGEYSNGSATGAGRSEYIWLPTEDGQVIPVGMYRNGKFFAIHSDHLGTPRLITNEARAVVWQWPYSAFGNNKPTGVLKATANPKQALTIQPVLLKATAPIEFNHRMPGQYADVETGLFYNYFRQYDSRTGRYTQEDPIGLNGGWNRFAYVDGNPLLGLDPNGLANGAAAQMWMKSPKSQTADVNFQMGLSGNLGAAVMGVGGEVGVATNSRLDDMCVYVQACGVAGPQLVASCGVSYSAGEGLPASGVSTSKGLTWFGGTGVVGAGQVTVNDSGQFQGSRGGVRGQVGAGAGVGYIECTQKMWCARR